MNIYRTVFIILNLLLLSGCASNQYAVTIDSRPSGAEVSCNGQSFGYAPITRYFEPDEATKKSGYLHTCQWDLLWVSGATATANNVFDLNQFPDGVITTTTRPDVDGYAQDAEFSLKVQGVRYQKRQAEAAENAAYQASTVNNKSIICNRIGNMTICN